MKRIVTLTTAAALAFTAACGTKEAVLEAPSTEATDKALEAIAHDLVPILEESPRLRRTLMERLAEKATGDFEVLIADLADLELEDGRTLGEALTGSGFSLPENVHIAAPLGLADWSEDTVPLVTFVPERPEHEIEELRYFGPGGVTHTRAANERPSEPVAVVGINERVGRASMADDAEVGTSRQALSTSPSYRDRYLFWIYIRDDHEGWFNGDPEIYIMCAFSNAGTGAGLNFRVNLPHVNRERATYYIDSRLVRHYTTYGDPMLCGVYEQDSTILQSFTLGFKGLSFRFDFGNQNDDFLGSQIVNYWDPNGMRYDTGDALFTINDSRCVPQCSGRQCGSNGCGGTCGTCSSNEQSCQNGQCVWDWNEACPGGVCP